MAPAANLQGANVVLLAGLEQPLAVDALAHEAHGRILLSTGPHAPPIPVSLGRWGSGRWGFGVGVDGHVSAAMNSSHVMQLRTAISGMSCSTLHSGCLLNGNPPGGGAGWG